MRRRPSGEKVVKRRAGADAPAPRHGRREGAAVTTMRRCGWLVFLLLGAWDPVTRKQADVAKANEQMKAGKPAEAEKLYQKALGELPSNPGVLYDLGAAHYAAAQAMPAGPERQKLLETAAQELRLAGDAPDTGLRASAHYNLGNTLYAGQKYKDAIEEYKKALRLEPAREDARHNLELALAKLPPPNPQQPPPQQQQGSQDDQKKPESGQSPQPSPSSSDDKKDQKPDEQQGQQDKKDQQQKSQADAQKDKDQAQNGQEKKGQEPKPNDKTDDQKEKQASAGAEQAGDKDMDRKLDLLEDRSKDLQVQKAQERARERKRSGPVKDW